MRGQVVRTPGMLMLTAGTAVQAAGLVLFSQQVPPNPKPQNLDPEPQTLNPEPCTLAPSPCVLPGRCGVRTGGDVPTS